MTLARELADTAGRPQVYKNLLINGGMNIWQRAITKSAASTTYNTADRWRFENLAGGGYTQSQSTDVPSGQGFGYSLKMDVTTADPSHASFDYTRIEQRIEGQNLQHLLKGTSSAKALTLSFWVKSDKTGTYICEIRDETNNRTISKSYTIDTAATWEKKTITFEGDTTGTIDNDNTWGLSVYWWLAAGSNYTSGTLNTSWAANVNANRAVGQANFSETFGNEWYMTGCQLEIGEAATDFEFEPYETILRKCERYFVQYGGNSSYNWICIGSNVTSTTFDGVMHFPTTMRVDPTLSTVGNWNVYDGAIDTTSGWSNIDGGERIGGVRATTSTQTVGNCSRVYANNDSSARFKFDAEL